MLLINTVALAYSKLKRHKEAVYYFKKQLKIFSEISKYLSRDNPPLCCSSIHRHWTPSPPKEYDLLCCYRVWWNDTFLNLIDHFEFQTNSVFAWMCWRQSYRNRYVNVDHHQKIYVYVFFKDQKTLVYRERTVLV